ncbi:MULTISPECIES: hypothetical protein [Bacillaceae]|uniref:Lipoprotein n=1 Tax=Evansella alkalicola TaxID=745819 RepID=A0ABS6JYR7_9BACI|nr:MULTISPECIES: hypothetical protein [Bacillaceae]MBU9722804.1 hypothetical protein [Bacillus alkalicola]
MRVFIIFIICCSFLFACVPENNVQMNVDYLLSHSDKYYNVFIVGDHNVYEKFVEVNDEKKLTKSYLVATSMEDIQERLPSLSLESYPTFYAFDTKMLVYSTTDFDEFIAFLEESKNK